MCMKTYDIKIIETYNYEIKINAKNQQDALKRAREYYKDVDDGCTGIADAISFEKVKFKILKKD